MTFAIAMGIALSGCHWIVSTDDLAVVADATVAAPGDAGQTGVDANSPGVDGSTSGTDGGAIDSGSMDAAQPGLDAGSAAADSGPLVGSTAAWADGGLLVMVNGVVSLVLDCNQGCALTEAHIKGGPNMLYGGSDSPEHFAGISFFDHAYSRLAPSPTATILESSPIARVQIDWTANNMGVGPDLTNGKTIYTLHPDGRLHRDEAFSLSGDSPDGWLLAYCAVDIGRVTHLEYSDNDKVMAGPIGTSKEFGSQLTNGYACTTNRNTHEVVGWAHRNTTPPKLVDFRIWEVDWDGAHPANSFMILMASDWATDNGTILKAGFSGHFLNMFDSRADCSAVRDQGKVFQSATTPLAVVAGRGTLVGTGYNEGGGYFEYNAVGHQLELIGQGNPFRPTTTILVHGIVRGSTPKVSLESVDLVANEDFLFGPVQGSADEGFVYLNRPWATQDLSILW